MKTHAFLTTIYREVFSFTTLSLTVFFALLYLFAIQLFLNHRLIVLGLANGFAPGTFFSLLISLFVGAFTSIDAEPFALYITVCNAFFVGLNVVLLGKALSWLRNQKKVHISLGGAALFSLVTAGCASCGLSLISILGLSVSFAFLPFHGQELRVLSLLLLLLSAFYMLKKLHEAKYCKI